MIDLKKRQLIKMAAALPLFNAALVSRAHTEKSDFSVSEINKVLDAWLKTMSLTPQDYLANRSVLPGSADKIREMSVEDFRSGKTLHVNGVVLSCTEAALIAELASALS
ncbi:hypothetical protein NO559_15110 [Dasania sp. GY-MA-18]|uniref:Uncharacterized protein n=1 Tax=Dasania phycosphaerae TaxID=2950436 RepID=A0A9J6RRJ0_9GAMM|nr:MULTISPECIES: hypothetical protein [Dasania]MCR8924112.1 hypothetical protein [Dasania sp. GY-MA-18]MCZ0866685.1 hypothetical protein [Dasania phycosphaerae]MCZ0870270.1 hypothetical protein [Dasania phycosphaerae]